MRELVTEVYVGLECYSGRGYKVRVDAINTHVRYTTLDQTFDHPPGQSWCLTHDDFLKHMYTTDLPSPRHVRPDMSDLVIDQILYSTDLATTYKIQHICKYGTDCSIIMIEIINVDTEVVFTINANTLLKHSIIIKDKENNNACS